MHGALQRAPESARHAYGGSEPIYGSSCRDARKDSLSSLRFGCCVLVQLLVTPLVKTERSKLDLPASALPALRDGRRPYLRRSLSAFHVPLGTTRRALPY